MSNKTKKPGKKFTLILIPVLVLILLLSLVALGQSEDDEAVQQSETAAAASNPMAEAVLEDVQINMLNGLQILDIGSYSGLNIEGDTTQFVENVLMLVVTNAGTDYIQYAEIELYNDGENYYFTLSTLAPGAKMVVLERDQTQFPEGTDFSAASAVHTQLAVFQETPSCYEDQLKIQLMNGAMNVTNVSGEDISGEIVIYYKNTSVDMYYGGVTYRTRIEGGLKTGEIRQIMLNTVYEAGTEVLYVTIAQ